MARRYWLMKSEPEVYSIDDLRKDGSTGWDGVRNYQARNFMRDEIKIDDRVLFYHSNSQPPGVAGVARVCGGGEPDPTAWNPKSDYYDAQSNREKPRWYLVDVEFVEKFNDLVSLDRLKETPGLKDMIVIRRGSRLSVQPVTRAQFDIVVGLGRGRGRR
jgi:predicted RNA-binding protein with PUA-like domain